MSAPANAEILSVRATSFLSSTESETLSWEVSKPHFVSNVIPYTHLEISYELGQGWFMEEKEELSSLKKEAWFYRDGMKGSKRHRRQLTGES